MNYVVGALATTYIEPFADELALTFAVFFVGEFVKELGKDVKWSAANVAWRLGIVFRATVGLCAWRSWWLRRSRCWLHHIENIGWYLPYSQPVVL